MKKNYHLWWRVEVKIKVGVYIESKSIHNALFLDSDTSDLERIWWQPIYGAVYGLWMIVLSPADINFRGRLSGLSL